MRRKLRLCLVALCLVFGLSLSACGQHNTGCEEKTQAELTTRWIEDRPDDWFDGTRWVPDTEEAHWEDGFWKKKGDKSYWQMCSKDTTTPGP